MVPKHGIKVVEGSMNLGYAGDTFLSSGSGNFPVARSRNTGQECPVNPQAGKPALRTRAAKMTWGLFMNLGAPASLPAGYWCEFRRRGRRRSRRRLAGSWSQCMRKNERADLRTCKWPNQVNI